MENEPLEIIRELLSAIDFLGGDSYEMDAVSKITDKAAEFLQKHDPIIENNKPNISRSHISGGTYCLKKNPNIITKAQNKRIAARYLNVVKNEVKCINRDY